MIHLLGDEHAELNLKGEPPNVILLAGLQGSGKTTSAAKLARFLKQQDNKKIMLASADVYRPAAIEGDKKNKADLLMRLKFMALKL